MASASWGWVGPGPGPGCTGPLHTWQGSVDYAGDAKRRPSVSWTVALDGGMYIVIKIVIDVTHNYLGWSILSRYRKVYIYPGRSHVLWSFSCPDAIETMNMEKALRCFELAIMAAFVAFFWSLMSWPIYFYVLFAQPSTSVSAVWCLQVTLWHICNFL